MPELQRYKKVERNIFFSLLNSLSSFFRLAGRSIARLVKICDRRLTIMIVPHSQSKVINFQTNIFALITGAVLTIGIAVSFIYFNRQSFVSTAEIARLREENRETLASLDELRDENNNLLQAAKRFQDSFSQSMSLLGINQPSVSKNAGKNGDLSSLFDVQELAHSSVRETADIRRLTSYLENTIQPIEQIAKMLESQTTLFADIPSVWPLKNGVGHVSASFGQSKHPISGQWYIHKGMDFSTWRTGDPIIATANGQVVTADYSPDFGYYIIIKHKHGFYTRYAHMNSFRVRKGEFVDQGEIIGTVGNTGISTGPHLHYEVHIGSDVVDPAKYINIRMSK